MSAWPPSFVNHSVHPAKCRANWFWDRKKRDGSRGLRGEKGGMYPLLPHGYFIFGSDVTLEGNLCAGVSLSRSFKPWTFWRQKDAFFLLPCFRVPLSNSAFPCVVTQRSSSFGGGRKHGRSFFRSSVVALAFKGDATLGAKGRPWILEKPLSGVTTSSRKRRIYS